MLQLQVGKFYKTNCGDKAECLSVNYNYTRGEAPGALLVIRSEGNSDSVWAVRQNGVCAWWPAMSIVSEWDDLEDIRKLPVDAKIFVRGAAGGEWVPRHFARVENGKVYTWGMGTTSWSAQGASDITLWNEYMLPE